MRALFLLMLRSAPQERISKHEAKNSSFETPAFAVGYGGLLRMRFEHGGGGQQKSPCPFAGMTRIRFKGCFSAPCGAPLGTGLM